MKFKLYIFLILFVCFSQYESIAQNTSKRDSIIFQKKTTKEDTNKIKLLLLLGDYYVYSLPDSASYFYKKALNLSKILKSISFEAKAIFYLGHIKKNQGNFEDALKNYENTKVITEMETKYQSEKKQLEIEKSGKEKELQTSEMKKQRLIILFVVCGLLFVLGFAVVLFRLFMQKKKANKIITEKKETLQMAYEEINTQKEEITVQRDSIQEQKEIIKEHQKEIQASINYARRIQQAVMPDLNVIASCHPELVEGEAKQSINDVTQQIASPAARNDEYQLVEIKGDKMPIGIHSNMQPFTNQIYQLQQGDTIYLMSDGYEDQFGGPNRKKFFAKNLKNLLTVNSQLPMADQKQILETTITEWIGNEEQIDDVTILGIKI